MVKVKFMEKEDRVKASTEWNEQVFEHRMAERVDIRSSFPVRVDMCDKSGLRRHEFTMRSDWRYVITSQSPEDGIEQWRTKAVQVETEQGTATMLVHPECTRAELTQDMKKALGIAPGQALEAEAINEPTREEVKDEPRYRLVLRTVDFLTDSTPEIRKPPQNSSRTARRNSRPRCRNIQMRSLARHETHRRAKSSRHRLNGYASSRQAAQRPDANSSQKAHRKSAARSPPQTAALTPHRIRLSGLRFRRCG
jgi:hypothetical protein